MHIPEFDEFVGLFEGQIFEVDNLMRTQLAFSH